jgi:hypothetical protein
MITTLITGFIGALLGGFIALGFDAFKEARRRKLEQQGAILRAQLALIGQFNTVNNLKDQFLDEVREDPARAQKLIHFKMQDANLRVDYGSLAFLLTDHAQFVLEIHSAEQSYLAAMDALNSRNEAFDKLHENSTLEKMDHTGRCTVLADPRHMKLLQDTTDGLYTSVDKARERLASQFTELRAIGKKLYPNVNFPKAGEKPRAIP